MNLQKAFLLLIFPVFFALPHEAKAQKEEEPKKSETLEKNRKTRKKGEKAAAKEHTKRHLSIQDKKTRKRMKKNGKRVNREARRRHKRL